MRPIMDAGLDFRLQAVNNVVSGIIRNRVRIAPVERA